MLTDIPFERHIRCTREPEKNWTHASSNAARLETPLETTSGFRVGLSKSKCDGVEPTI